MTVISFIAMAPHKYGYVRIMIEPYNTNFDLKQRPELSKQSLLDTAIN